jgi:hypothetical protein
MNLKTVSILLIVASGLLLMAEIWQKIRYFGDLVRFSEASGIINLLSMLLGLLLPVALLVLGLALYQNGLAMNEAENKTEL